TYRCNPKCNRWRHPLLLFAVHATIKHARTRVEAHYHHGRDAGQKRRVPSGCGENRDRVRRKAGPYPRRALRLSPARTAILPATRLTGIMSFAVRPTEQVSGARMPLPKRDWLEMTWQDIAGARTERWIAVLPLAAIEQHGPHLPLGVDSFIAEAYLSRAREMLPDDLPVTFLPIQRVGISTEHLAYPGTLTLTAKTAIAAWTELGESLARAGLRKLVLVTSHGGNVAAMELVARDLRARLAMLAVTVGWHRFGYPDGIFSGEERKHGIHGGDIETSLMLAGTP